jgi:hypothetical protein
LVEALEYLLALGVVDARPLILHRQRDSVVRLGGRKDNRTILRRVLQSVLDEVPDDSVHVFPVCPETRQITCQSQHETAWNEVPTRLFNHPRGELHDIDDGLLRASLRFERGREQQLLYEKPEPLRLSIRSGEELELLVRTDARVRTKQGLQVSLDARQRGS